MFPGPSQKSEERPPQSSSDSSIWKKIQELQPVVKDEFQDIVESLEQTFYKSLFSETYVEKASHAKNFISLGIELLPEEEKKFINAVRTFLKEEIDVVKLDSKPFLDDAKILSYEIRSNIRGGFTTKCMAQDLQYIHRYLIEVKNEETYNMLSRVRSELTKKLADYGIMELSRELYYKEGRLSEYGHLLRSDIEASLDDLLDDDEEEEEE